MVCPDIVRSINLMELMELESIDCLDSFWRNIFNGRENYEWDIISIFKIYNDHIENPPPGIPHCACPICNYLSQYTPQHYTDQITTIKRYIYIMWFMKTITDEFIIERIKKFINPPDRQSNPVEGSIDGGMKIRKRIDEFYKYIYDKQIELPEECQDICKSKEYYYRQLFGIPYMLSSIGVPDQHYIHRESVFFSDSIIGHPKASHGWFREALDDMEEFGGFDKLLTLINHSSVSSTNSVFGEIEKE